MATEAGEVTSREEGEAIDHALTSLLASPGSGWTPRAAEVGRPQGPPKERKPEMGQPRSQHFVLASRDIESVTRRVGRWGFSKVYPWNGRIQSPDPAVGRRKAAVTAPLLKPPLLPRDLS